MIIDGLDIKKSTGPNSIPVFILKSLIVISYASRSLNTESV